MNDTSYSQERLSSFALFSPRCKIMEQSGYTVAILFFLYASTMHCFSYLGLSCKSIRESSVYPLHLQFTAVIKSRSEVWSCRYSGYTLQCTNSNQGTKVMFSDVLVAFSALELILCAVHWYFERGKALVIWSVLTLHVQNTVLKCLFKLISKKRLGLYFCRPAASGLHVTLAGKKLEYSQTVVQWLVSTSNLLGTLSKAG